MHIQYHSICWISITDAHSLESSSAQSACYLMHPHLLCNRLVESLTNLQDSLTTVSISQVLCTLFILNELLVSAVIRLNPKHWVKRPLNHNIIEYAVAGVDPLWDLGVRMMRRAGEAGVAGAIRLSRHALQRNYDREDQAAPAQNTRCASFLPSVNKSRFGCIQTSVSGLATMGCYGDVSCTANLNVPYAACMLFPVMLTQCFRVPIIIHWFEATVQSLQDQRPFMIKAYYTCVSLLTAIKHFKFLTQPC